MKCPACGFETDEEQGWCDFCKEPFRKKKAPEAPKPGAADAAQKPQEKAPALEASPKGAAAAVPVEAAQPGVLSKLTAEQAFELLKSMPQERIPEIPPIVRYAAWILWGLICLLMLVVGIFAINRSRMQRTNSGVPHSSVEETNLPGAGLPILR